MNQTFILLIIGTVIILGVASFGYNQNDQAYENRTYALHMSDNCEELYRSIDFYKELDRDMWIKSYPAYKAFDRLLEEKNCEAIP